MAVYKTEDGIKYTTRRFLKGAKLDIDFTIIPTEALYIIKNNSAFRIYIYLCDKNSKDYGYAFPSMRKISSDLNMSTATVQKSIKYLEDLKLISIDKFERKDNSEFPNNCYIIKYPIIISDEVIELNVSSFEEDEYEDLDDTVVNLFDFTRHRNK